MPSSIAPYDPLTRCKSIGAADVDGFEIGNATDARHGTGCTVIICREGAVAGVDVRGGAPATRETDLLRPENLVERINAVVLSGGSAFGLDAAGGVMRFLCQEGVGFETGVAKVPIVCGASLFDLAVGDADVRPDADMGYRACEQAASNGEVPSGNIGAGTGACVGKLLGPSRMMKSGLGTFGIEYAGIRVAAIVATNACGTVIDACGRPLAGVVSEDGRRILDADEAVDTLLGAGAMPFDSNTTIACIVTDARLTKAQATKVATMCHDALARRIKPVHTTNDGDTVFVMASCRVDSTVDAVGILGTRALEEAITKSVTKATSAYGLKCASDFGRMGI